MGLNFADEDEACAFQQMVEEKIQKRSQRMGRLEQDGVMKEGCIWSSLPVGKHYGSSKWLWKAGLCSGLLLKGT